MLNYKHTIKMIVSPNQSILVHCSNGSYNGVLEALNNGADVNVIGAYGKTPLIIACINSLTRHIPVISLLISRGANIYHSDNCNRTPISIINNSKYNDIINAFNNAIHLISN